MTKKIFKNLTNRIVCLILLLLTVVSFSACRINVGRPRITEEDYKNEYESVLMRILESNGKYLDDVDYSLFQLIFLDEDNVPEMVVSYADEYNYFSELYSMQGMKAEFVGRYGVNSKKYDSSIPFYGLQYVPLSGVISEYTEYDDDESVDERIYKFKNGQLIEIAYFSRKDLDGQAWFYYINQERVEAEKFEQEYKKSVPGEFIPVPDDDYDYMFELSEGGIAEFDSCSFQIDSTNDNDSSTTQNLTITMNSTTANTVATTTFQPDSSTILPSTTVMPTTTTLPTVEDTHIEETTQSTLLSPENIGEKYLFDMDTFTGSPVFETITVSDNFDKEYKRMYRKNSAPFYGGDNEFSYLLNGQYSEIEGLMIWAKAYKDDTTGYYSMEFYDGDTLLYETDQCNYMSGPINFSFSVKNVRILTVKFNGFSNKGNFDFVTRITIK